MTIYGSQKHETPYEITNVILRKNLLRYCPLILYINYTVRNVNFHFSQLKLDTS